MKTCVNEDSVITSCGGDQRQWQIGYFSHKLVSVSVHVKYQEVNKLHTRDSNLDLDNI